jgi:hypothetical protein
LSKNGSSSSKLIFNKKDFKNVINSDSYRISERVISTITFGDFSDSDPDLENLLREKSEGQSSGSDASVAKNDSPDVDLYKNYFNSKYGFTFNYPVKAVTLTEKNNNTILVDYVQNDVNFKDFKGQWEIKVYENPGKSNLNDWLNSFLATNNAPGRCKISNYDSLKNSFGDFLYDKIVLVEYPGTGGVSCKNEGFYAMSPDNSTVVWFNQIFWSQGFISDIIKSFKFTPVK